MTTTTATKAPAKRNRKTTAPAAELSPTDKKAMDSRMKIQTQLPGGRTAIATLTANMLMDLGFISTYGGSDPQSPAAKRQGYQRSPLPERFPQIGRYYAKDDHADLIPPLLVNVRVYTPADRKRFDTLFNAKDIYGIHKAFGRSAFSIIDGQHRRGGLFWAWENVEEFNPDIPVMLVYGLKFDEEAKLFDDVNSTQRKVSKALIERTSYFLGTEQGTHRYRVQELASRLMEDGDSVWHGLIDEEGRGKSRTGMSLTYESIRRSTASMFPAPVVERLEARGLDPIEVYKKFWSMVSRACAPAWDAHTMQTEDGEDKKVEYRLKELAGFHGVNMLGKDVLNTALDVSNTDEEFWDAVTDRVSKLGAVDWSKRPDNPWMSGGAGHSGAPQVYRTLYDLVYLDKFPGSP